jgi:hypothetical protein
MNLMYLKAELGSRSYTNVLSIATSLEVFTYVTHQAESAPSAAANTLALFATSPLAPIIVRREETPFKSTLSSSEGKGCSSNRPNAQLSRKVETASSVVFMRRIPLTKWENKQDYSVRNFQVLTSIYLEWQFFQLLF